MGARWTWTSPGPGATSSLGRWLGEHAYPGLVVTLVGDLGAGKTCLVQGLARGLGIPADVPITSPTFSLVNPYEGRLPLYHLDLYRLADSEELELLGFRDLLAPPAVTVVEWGERFPELLPRNHVRITMGHRSPRTRTIVIEAIGEGPESLLVERLEQHHRTRPFGVRTGNP